MKLTAPACNVTFIRFACDANFRYRSSYGDRSIPEALRHALRRFDSVRD